MGWMTILHMSLLTFLHSSIILSSPTPLTAHSKRANPKIATGIGLGLFTEAQAQQITEGFADACTLTQAALANLKSGDRTIFNKYFIEDNFDNVQGVFTNIVGGDTAACSADLADITFHADAEVNPACTTPETLGSTRDREADNPTIILCPPALAHPNIAQRTCDDLDPRTSWKMEVLGAIILHEYTHVQLLVEKFLGSLGTIDTLQTDPEGNTVYGPIDTRNVFVVTTGAAQHIADSYTWYALEAFWTGKCGTFADPIEGDDEDPACKDSQCTDHPAT